LGGSGRFVQPGRGKPIGCPNSFSGTMPSVEIHRRAGISEGPKGWKSRAFASRSQFYSAFREIE
jgi:hypothetical protein